MSQAPHGPNRPTHVTPPHGRQAFPFREIVGGSAELRSVLAAAHSIACAAMSTVLLVGETGTGKELFARGIHAAGTTAESPFVAVNCAAIPESLLESELFGHEAGAFTGARGRKQGLMEFAGGGTLFLDELHHLPPLLQPKLLRVLQERKVRRLGGSDEVDVACRIVAATNIGLEDAVEQGSFREDLFYRLNVMRVDVPPLRARTEDIPLLAQHFLDIIARGHRTASKVLRPDAIPVLAAHSWPGNVRELRNVMERAFVVAGEDVSVGTEHILIQSRTNRSVVVGGTIEARAGDIVIPPGGKSLAAIEREAAVLTLQLARGNRTHAARMLGISRPTLARILRDSESARLA